MSKREMKIFCLLYFRVRSAIKSFGIKSLNLLNVNVRTPINLRLPTLVFEAQLTAYVWHIFAFQVQLKAYVWHLWCSMRN